MVLLNIGATGEIYYAISGHVLARSLLVPVFPHY